MERSREVKKGIGEEESRSHKPVDNNIVPGSYYYVPSFTRKSIINWMEGYEKEKNEAKYNTRKRCGNTSWEYLEHI